jgi:hypothetical protein
MTMTTLTALRQQATWTSTIATVVATLALTGCAAPASEVDTSPAGGEDTSADDTASDGSGSFLPGSGDGEFLFGFTPYGIEDVINCDPATSGVSVESLPDSAEVGSPLDVTISGRSEDGGFMRFFVITVAVGDTEVTSADYVGPEGTWSNDGNAIVSIDDGRLSGSIPVINDAGDASELVQFNVPLPAELTDCS